MGMTLCVVLCLEKMCGKKRELEELGKCADV